MRELPNLSYVICSACMRICIYACETEGEKWKKVDERVLTETKRDKYRECEHNLTLLLSFIDAGLSSCNPCRKFRQEMRTRILLQVVLSMSAVSSCLVLSSNSSTRRQREQCTFLAVLLQYFPLAMFFWTLVEAGFLYRLFLGVYAKEIRYFFTKCCLFAWGMCPVGIFRSSMAVFSFFL